jgi:hypothetical protein
VVGEVNQSRDGSEGEREMRSGGVRDEVNGEDGSGSSGDMSWREGGGALVFDSQEGVRGFARGAGWDGRLKGVGGGGGGWERF